MSDLLIIYITMLAIPGIPFIAIWITEYTDTKQDLLTGIAIWLGFPIAIPILIARWYIRLPDTKDQIKK